MTENTTKSPDFSLENLANAFAQYELPKFMKEQIKVSGSTIFGSRSFTKTLLFAAEAQMDNDIFDYWVSIKPQRQEGENYDAYKRRLKFQKALDKFKPYIYDYSVYEKN
jgi:hypothetical protein